MIDVGIDTNEHVVLKEWEYRVAERYLIKTEIIMDTVVTVSYTHLDVYKRQTINGIWVGLKKRK